MVEHADGEVSLRHWFVQGLRAALSIPGLILSSAFIGFAGLASEAGITLAQSLFMIVTIWALPSMVVLVGAVQNNVTLPAAALAVALSSVRLTPMVAALVPEMRAAGTRRFTLYGLSNFIAVTSWVISFQRFPDVPRAGRTSFYGGLALGLLLLTSTVVAIVHPLAADLPPTLSAALLLVTPVYFLTSIWGSAREVASKYAMVAGILLGPLFNLVLPELSLLATGLVGGGIAYALHRARKRKAAP